MLRKGYIGCKIYYLRIKYMKNVKWDFRIILMLIVGFYEILNKRNSIDYDYKELFFCIKIILNCIYFFLKLMKEMEIYLILCFVVV